MKRLFLIFTALLIGVVANPTLFADASHEKPGSDQKMEKEHGHHHRLIDESKLEELTKKGYTKEEIFMGAMLAKKSNKDVDEVLSVYKEKQTWENTAKEIGVDLEELKRINSMVKWDKFINEHKDAVVDHLATYANKKPADIQAHLDKDISLRFLIGAAAMAKLSNKDLDEIVALKKDGQSFHDMIKTLNIKHEDLHNELNKFRTEVEQKVQEPAKDQAE